MIELKRWRSEEQNEGKRDAFISVAKVRWSFAPYISGVVLLFPIHLLCIDQLG